MVAPVAVAAVATLTAVVVVEKKDQLVLIVAVADQLFLAAEPREKLAALAKMHDNMVAAAAAVLGIRLAATEHKDLLEFGNMYNGSYYKRF
jgi:hypothetical protein